MGSATRESIGAARGVLSEQKALDPATGEQLLEAALVVDGSSQLRAALADGTANSDNRRGIVDSVFDGFTSSAKAILESLVTGRWSSEEDLVSGIEELGIRALALSAPATVSIDSELFEFLTAVTKNSELELALGSKLAAIESKVYLVDTLLSGKASAQTVAILRALLAHPRGRRIGELISYAAELVASEAGFTIATVTVASPLGAAQSARVSAALAAKYGTDVRINEIVDPSILGGMRVQIGAEVIDGTISHRIAELRLQLAS